MASKGLGPLPRRGGSALAHGCDRGGRVVLPLARAAAVSTGLRVRRELHVRHAAQVIVRSEVVPHLEVDVQCVPVWSTKDTRTRSRLRGQGGQGGGGGGAAAKKAAAEQAKADEAAAASAAWGESAQSLGRSRGLIWRLAVAQCRVGGRLAQVRQDPSTVFVAETLPMKRPVRPPAAGAQQLEAGGRSGEPGVAASCIKTVATSPPPAAAPRSSAASTVSTTQQHEYLGGQRRRLGGASSSIRGEAFTSGASCSMFAQQLCAPRVYVGLVGHFRPRGFWASGKLAIDRRRVQPAKPGGSKRCVGVAATLSFANAAEIVDRFSAA